MNFEEVYKNYLDYARSRHKKQGFEIITRDFNLHILPYFKDKSISKLEKIDIVNWQTEILKFNYSNSFNRNLYYEFSAFMKYCIYCGYISENLVLSVEKFHKRFEEKNHNVYNISQFRRFRRYVDNYIIKQYFNFMYFYGTRPSEAMALRFSDLNNKYIHIQHSIERRGNRELDTPKNQSSIRYLKLSFLTRFRLLKLKCYYIKKYGSDDFDYFIFGGKKPLAPTTIDRVKKKACLDAHIFEITQHEFRHSYATRMIHKKVPIDIVSKSLGHSTVSMTVDVYLHQEKSVNHTLSSRFNFFEIITRDFKKISQSIITLLM